MVLRNVPDDVIEDTSQIWISVRYRLGPAFSMIPGEIVGAPHLDVRPFRQQVEAILSGGVFQYLHFVEQNKRNSLSLSWRPTEFSMGRDESVNSVGRSLYAETNTEVGERLGQSIIGLANLIWSLKSLLKKKGLIKNPLRKYLFSELGVVERCCRDLGGSDFIQFMPNARTNKRIPEPVLRGLAVNILKEMEVVRRYIHEVRHDPRAVDILTGIKYSPLMNLQGVRFQKNLCAVDIMDRLASAHPRFRRNLWAECFKEGELRVRIDNGGRILISQGGGSPQFRRALDVVAVNGRQLILPWGYVNSGETS